MGDVNVSLAPVLAGLLIGATGYPLFDPVIAAGTAVRFGGAADVHAGPLTD